MHNVWNYSNLINTSQFNITLNAFYIWYKDNNDWRLGKDLKLDEWIHFTEPWLQYANLFGGWKLTIVGVWNLFKGDFRLPGV